MIGVGPLWNGSAHPSGRAEFPPPYPTGTAIGEHLRVESLLRVAQGRLLYLVNNMGPKWSRRKCWACGNRYSPQGAKSCSYCLTPLRDLRFLMSTRWESREFPGYEAMVSRRLDHFGLITPVVVYYRDGRMLSVYQYGGERLLLDEPAPIAADRLARITHFVARMLGYLHQQGVVLRDIGGHNLLVMPDGTVRLFDLDVLEMTPGQADVEAHATHPPWRTLQRLGQLMLRYCAPEDEELTGVLEQAADGRFTDAQAFARAIESLHARGGTHPASGRAAAYTDVGLVRSRNEDTWAWRRLSDRSTLYLVADGMGGHAGGDIASGVAARTVVDTLLRAPKGGAAAEALEEAFTIANRAVRERGDRIGDRIGSTIVAAIVEGTTATIANTGDSRAYLWREGQLKQLSRDHTVGQDLIEAGKLTIEQARKNPHAHLLTSNLGADDDDLEIATRKVALRPGDRLLLCSDGLWGKVHDERIAYLLGLQDDRRKLVEALVREAYGEGGDDNISVLIVDVP